MLLGVHVLVRNEADVLARCLGSVAGSVDEIVVADTGSTDDSAAIARRCGARVVHLDWEDDFAAARNAALAYARTVWVLVLDADEWLEGGTEAIMSLRRELLRTPQHALRLRMEHNLGREAQAPYVRSEAVRLFRADKGLRYAGEIHEQLVRPCGAGGGPSAIDGPLAATDLTILHDGYVPAVIAGKRKAERNGRILSRQLAGRPDDPFVLYNYGVTMCQLGQPEEAVRSFGRSYSFVPPAAPYRPTLVRDYAKALLAAGSVQAAAELLEKETAAYADYSDLQLLYGDSLLGAGMPVEAGAAYEAAIRAGEGRTGRYITEAGAGGYLARMGLARSRLRLGLPGEAVRHYEAALEEAPHEERAWIGLADALQRIGVSDGDIARLLARRFPGEEKDKTVRSARILAAVGADGEALAAWRAAYLPDGDPPGAERSAVAPSGWPDRRLFAECLARAGCHAEAAALLDRYFGGGAESAAAAAEAPGEAAELALAAASWALCRWTSRRRLTEPELAALAETERPFYGQGGSTVGTETMGLLRAIEWLLSGETEAPANAPCGTAAELWLERAVGLGLVQAAWRLARAAKREERFEALLYDHGYAEEAAELMLRRYAGEGRLPGGHSFRLGEMLYRRSRFAEALAMFEQAEAACGGEEESGETEGLAPADDGGTAERARLGAAAACLQLAIAALRPEDAGLSRGWDGGWPESDERRLRDAIGRIDGIGWQTEWDGVQRRRSHGGNGEAHFLMHDRQE